MALSVEEYIRQFAGAAEEAPLPPSSGFSVDDFIAAQTPPEPKVPSQEELVDLLVDDPNRVQTMVEPLPKGEISPKQRKAYYQTQRELIKLENKAKFLMIDPEVIGDTKIQSASNLLGKGFSGTMKALEKLLIPQQMLFNTLEQVQQGTLSVDGFVKGVWGALKEKPGPDALKLMNNALDSLQSAGYIDKDVSHAIQNNPAWKALGFLENLTIDPIAATAILPLTKAGKAIQAAERARGRAREFATAMDIGENVSNDIRGFLAEGKALLAPEARGLEPTLFGQVKASQRKFLGLAATPAKAVGVLPGSEGIERLSDSAQRFAATALSRATLTGKETARALLPLRTQKGFEKAVDTFRFMFRNETTNPALNDLLLRTQKLMEFGRREALEKAIEIGKRLQPEDIEQINLVSKVLDDAFTPIGGGVYKKGEETVRLAENVAGVTEELRTAFDEMRDSEMQRNILRTVLENYFPRIATTEARESLEEAGRLHSYVILSRADKIPFSKERLTKELTLGEATKRLAEGKGFADFFITDPAVAFAIRKTGSTRAVAVADMLDEVGKNFALLPGQKGVDLGEKIPRLKGLMFDKDIAKDIERLHDIVVTPARGTGQADIALQRVARIYDTVQNWWKSWALGVFPAYHFRNAVGNVWQAYLGGLDNPARYMDAHRVARGMDGAIQTAHGKLTFDQIRKLAKKWSVEGTGLYGADIPETVVEAVKAQGPGATKEMAKKLLFPTRENTALKLGFEVGRNIENNARLALFIDGLVKGKPAKESAQWVGKHLFDYSDITRFEQGYMKRAMPFYTWSRKNIPLQLEYLVRRPQIFSAAVKSRNVVQGDRNEPPPYMAEFIRENVPVRIRTLPNGNHQYFLLGGWWTGADLEKVLHPIDAAMDLISPIPKGIGTATGAVPQLLEFLAPKAAEETRYRLNEQVPFFGTTMKRKYADILKTFRPVGEAERFYRGYKKSPVSEGARYSAPLLRALTGIKTFEVSPAQQKAFSDFKRADRLREILRREQRERIYPR